MDSKLTPMMKQYMEIKKKHQDDILFFRMGDFYEMFFEDAKVASKILDIALTSRQNDVPMCGIPHHAAESYTARLIKAGKRVAICEQLESVPSSGTIVKRDVVRIMTPGTVIEQNLLLEDENNFLSSVVFTSEMMSCSFVDLSTGEFVYTTLKKDLDLFRGIIVKFHPREIIYNSEDQPQNEIFFDYLHNLGVSLHSIDTWLFDKDYMSDTIKDFYKVSNLKGLGITEDETIVSIGAVLQYINDTQRQAVNHVKAPQAFSTKNRMILDDSTMTHLELLTNQQDSSRNRTLFSVLNYCKTPMGKRTLERNLIQPLTEHKEIEDRLDMVQYLVDFHDLRVLLHKEMQNIFDIERLLSRFSMGRVFPRNFVSLSQSIDSSVKIKNILLEQPEDHINKAAANIPGLKKLQKRIDSTISEEPALSPDQGRVIKEGFNHDLDHLYSLKTDAKTWILQYQEDQKKELEIPTLKVKYNRILGYYIEISKGQVKNIPQNYLRKQTLVGSERYTTEELQKFETDIVSASDKIVTIEKKEIDLLVKDILNRKKDLQDLATSIGYLDFLSSLAESAHQNRYSRPIFNTDNRISIRDGRHPIVEKYYTKEAFIPNDVTLDSSEHVIQIITGPNMSGKSTYIRMAAVLQLMAQCGSYVPAAESSFSLCDRIFTRIGASDNISRGESTFLVEMNETANILNNATDKSLIIMDEVGRGTSTYDGLSIAWAIVEYLQRYLKAKTLFATHYHELTQLGKRKGIENLNVMVKENMNTVEFLHKVVKGSADKSYGIHVAKLAGIPSKIINRSDEILNKLESNKKTHYNEVAEEENAQLEIFNASNHRVVQAIKGINLDDMSPIDALNELYRLKKLIE